MRGLLLAFVLSLGAMSPARANWYEASTKHFVIDADTTEPRIRDFAIRLERFDHALRTLYGVGDDPSRHSNRVHVYAVSPAQILALCRGCGAGTAGFYQARLGGSAIFTSTLSGKAGIVTARNLELDPQEVLLHEYAHHFMYSSFPGAFPIWFSEGFADFNANVLFRPDGTVVMGLAANYRAYGLRGNASLSATSLMAPSRQDLSDPERHELIYGRGWLLMHYLMMDEQHRKMAQVYQDAISEGKPSVVAGKLAFGDLRKLDKTLDRYANGKLPLLALKPGPDPVVEVRPLTAGAAAMMPVHLRSTAGVDERIAARVWPDAERRAAPYDDDPVVQVELAEAEYDAGRLDQADAAAARALAADPRNVRAMLYRGQVAARRLVDAKSRDGDGWAAARRWFVKANRTDTEATPPLFYYYLSYLQEGVTPPDIATAGLAKAQAMAPEADDARWLLAKAQLDAGKPEEAKALLQPIAYAPHAKGGRNVALTIIERIDAGDAKAAAAAFPTPGSETEDDEAR